MGESRSVLYFVGPAFLLLILVLGFPAMAAVLQSFELLWVPEAGFSLANYQRLVTDPGFHKAFANTAVYVSCVVAFHMSLGLGAALLLNADIPGKWLFRVAAILPWTIPDVIGGIVWRFMFDTLPGFVNGALLRMALVDQPLEWLGHPKLAMFSLIVAEGWRGYPFIMLILLAGLQAIPQHLYEAAAVDGANRWHCFRYITLPSLKKMFMIALVLDVIWECRLFGMVYSMTGGGPGNATEVISIMTYRQYFEYYNNGYAAAIAVALALLMLAVSTPYLRMSMREER